MQAVALLSAAEGTSAAAGGASCGAEWLLGDGSAVDIEWSEWLAGREPEDILLLRFNRAAAATAAAAAAPLGFGAIKGFGATYAARSSWKRDSLSHFLSLSH